MENNEKELRKVLFESTPILFLGAGFSLGSKNVTGALPNGEKLKKDIFLKFIDDSYSDDDKKEILEYNLQELCQFIYDSLGKKERLHQYIVSRFIGTRPEEYHLLLNSYPWKKIYSVNIDDLVENIYSKNGEKLTIQNGNNEKKKVRASTELYKLHGCVNQPEEGLIFSSSEYTSLISKRNFKFDSLTSDLVNHNIIFVGASLDESDIDFYISKYEDAGFQLRKGKLIFIDPMPNLKVKTRIKKMNGILLQWTTEQFLRFVDRLKYNPTELESSRKALNYAGFYLYSDILDVHNNAEVYESKLYEGYACQWRDVIDNWVFDTTKIDEIQKFCCELDIKCGESYCVSIYGNRFAGKGCALKKIGAFLYKVGCKVIEFKGHFFDINVLKRYISNCNEEKIVLLVEDAAFEYKMIEVLLKTNWKNNKLLIVTTSRTYYHYKKRYYLEDNPFCEFELADKIDRKNAKLIYYKLCQKGYTGNLPEDEKKAIASICRKDSFVDLFSDITYGNGFRKRLYNAANNITVAPNNILNLYVDLVIFDKADLPYYPSELFVQQYDVDLSVFVDKSYKDLDSDQKNIIDFLRIDKNGLVLKNRIFVDMLWKKISKSKIIDELQTLLIAISSYVSEESNTYWRVIFESLMKEEILSKVFKLKDSQIGELYYRLKDYYSDISYYWLQLGIAEQKQKDYSKALNHLLMAQKIRPRAYQIQHAIARNYLKNANDEKNIIIAKELFAIGENKMRELINSSEHYKSKARYFSIHCFVHEKIRFYQKYPQYIDKSECKKLKTYIDRIIDEDIPFLFELLKEYMNLLSDNNILSIISMKPDDPYFKALSDNKTIMKNIDDIDILVDSY